MRRPVHFGWAEREKRRYPRLVVIHPIRSCAEMLNAIEPFASNRSRRPRCGRVIVVLGAGSAVGRFRLPQQSMRARRVRWSVQQASAKNIFSPSEFGTWDSFYGGWGEDLKLHGVFASHSLLKRHFSTRRPSRATTRISYCWIPSFRNRFLLLIKCAKIEGARLFIRT